VQRALLISPPELAHTPAMFRRLDGSSRFQFRGLETYVTRETLDAEARLLEAGRCLDGPGVQAQSAAVVIGHARIGRRLPVGQAQAVQDVVASGRVLDVLVGAAGTGKSTIMAGVRQVWESHYGQGSVIGLAPSAAAAEVLSQVAGIPSENTAKWLTENARNALRFEQIGELQARLRRASPSLGTRAATSKLRALIGQYRQWSLRPGQLIIVDEASMAGTFDLDTLTTKAWQAGAKVLLVGDWGQLSPVPAGGAFSLLVNDRDDAPELLDVRRFAHEWERQASLGLRNGLVGMVDTYDTHGRITGGGREAMLGALYGGWRADIAAGRRSLMIAGDNETVRDLNPRARADRVAAGAVQDGGVELSDGTPAGSATWSSPATTTEPWPRAVDGSRTATAGPSSASTAGVLSRWCGPAGAGAQRCHRITCANMSSSGTPLRPIAPRAKPSTQPTPSSRRRRSGNRCTSWQPAVAKPTCSTSTPHATSTPRRPILLATTSTCSTCSDGS
jgi:hypothetical protein